jgi:hypothetical protein
MIGGIEGESVKAWLWTRLHLAEMLAVDEYRF